MLGRGGGDVHHHSLFAGLSAATAGVIIAGIGLWALWHRIAEQLGVAFLVAMWILLMSGCVTAVAGAAWVCVMLLGHARRTLARPPIPATLTAQAIPVSDYPAVQIPAPQQIPAPATAPELEAADERGNHWHFHSKEAVDAALAALERRELR
jgi:hypothetical protein